MTTESNTDVAALLVEYRPWLRTVANGMCGNRPQWREDLAQEGWIAIWRGTKNFNPGKSVPLDAWLKRCAVKRMSTVIRDWCAQCRDMRITDTTDPVDMIDLLESGGSVAYEPELMEAAYHDGRLLAALSTLTKRERWYVEQRFWGGLTHGQMEETLGRYAPQTMWRWIRPKLEAELAKVPVMS